MGNMAVKCSECDTDNTQDSQFCKKCAAPLTSAEEAEITRTKTLDATVEELTTGSTFANRYQIIEELGKGGMGKVYRALDKKLNEEVAIKLIKPEIAEDKKTVERFRNELRLARKISHRNIGRMYELMEYLGNHYITMEYVPGQDLRSLVRQTGKLTAETAISIAKEICGGLAEAHRLGVIHRDLKPSNILIDKNGDAKIIKNAGGIISHPFGSAMRSLLIGIYELGVNEILVIGHTDCGARSTDSKKMIEKMKAHGITQKSIDQIRYFGVDFDSWLGGFSDLDLSVKRSVELICNHPLVPEEIKVYGLVIDSVTGQLRQVI